MISFVENSVCPSPRSMLEWAEAEIVVPNGRFAGLPFRADRQPAHRLLLEEFDRPTYRRFAVTGCTQSGKSLCAFVIPILYYLFEVGETLCAGVPLADMAHDKFSEDILPVLEQTRYKGLLPLKGAGSRGGKMMNAVRFLNGCTLRFMSASGGDKARAGFTSRVLVATEVDGYDHVSDRSDEADKLRQMEGRLLAYGDTARTFLECTVSTEDGRIWQEYNAGTRSRIMIPCPECGDYVCLERESLVGWQDAATEVQAANAARWACPACGSVFDEGGRVKAHERAVLAHDGQTVDKHGNVAGSGPETFTFSYRWNAANNMFYDAAMLAVEEWREAKNPDRESAERKMQQQFWTRPYHPPDSMFSLPEIVLEQRAAHLPRGIVPADAERIYVGVDVHNRLLYWTVAAFKMEGGRGHILDYGRSENPIEEYGLEKGMSIGFGQIHDMVQTGFASEVGGILHAKRVMVDEGYMSDLVRNICKKYGWIPCRGFGATQNMGGKRYWQPKGTGARVIQVGDGWHVSRLPSGHDILEHDTDLGKSWLQARFNTPDDQDGVLTMFGEPGDHVAFRKHLTAEQQILEKGVFVWRANGSNNHWMDSTNLAALGARLDGVSVVGREKPTAKPPQNRPVMRPQPQVRKIRRKY